MQPTFSSRFHKYASIFALALIAVVIAILFWGLMLPRKDFYNELWGPAYLLVRGQSPYNTASLNPVLPAAWLPMSIGFFFPFGWLGETPALQGWYLFTILEICLIVYLAQGEKINLFNTIAAALMCFFFPLTLNHLNLGQFSVTVTACWALAVRLCERSEAISLPHKIDSSQRTRTLLAMTGAMLIALALSKPHLCSLALLGFSYRQTARGGLRPMLSLWARILISCFILCLPLFIAYPNWIPDALVSMGKNGYWAFPSLYVLFARFIGAWGYALAGGVALIVVALNFQIWKKLPPQNALYWSLALAPLTTPYVGSWDFVVLFPLLISTYVNVDWKRKSFLWIAYLVAWGLMARIQMMEVSRNHYFWWVPLWFIGAVAATKAARDAPLFLKNNHRF
ncbi:MAG: hypothetical protein PHQ36_10235 [Anaerolineales bacterium]|nr:hypothetical protein [Anaerolineales bacterium]